MKISYSHAAHIGFNAITLVVLAAFCGPVIAEKTDTEIEKMELPVSINALMVTLIDHSAHYIWDYGNLQGERELSDKEWQIVEYYAVQLAASGPLITIPGTGGLDHSWVANRHWRELSTAMMENAMVAHEAARNHDHVSLQNAGNALVDTCVSCHEVFKPSIPTEGIFHDPQYDHLYHLMSPKQEPMDSGSKK